MWSSTTPFPTTHLRQAIYHHIPRATLQAAVKEAQTLRRPHGYFDFLYTITAICASSPRNFWTPCPSTPIRMTIHYLKRLRYFVRSIRPSSASCQTTRRVDFVPDTWRRFVMPNGQPARRAYELCALSTLRDTLRSGDIYLPHSRRYADPETFLIPRAAGLTLREEVCQQLELDPTGTHG